MDIDNLEYGEQTTADMVLRLLYCKESECEGSPIHLHSHLLSQKSDYFKSLLSGRWSSPPEHHPNNVIDFTINSGNTPHEYIRCIKLLYGPKHDRYVHLSGVSETLKTLQVASQWLIGEAAEVCMEYLEAIPWTDGETLQIKSLLSSLQMEVGPDMLARLSACQAKYLKVMETELKQMLSSLRMRENTESVQTTCYKLLAANCGDNGSKQLKDLTKSLLLQEARHMLKAFENMRVYQDPYEIKNLLWFIRTLCSMEVTEYASFLGDAFCAYKNFRDNKNAKNELLNMVDDAFKKMASGKMILRRNDRLKLVTNWLPIIQCLPDDLEEKNSDLRTSLQQGLDRAINTLPAEDYILISTKWDRGPRDLYSTPAYNYWIDKLRSGCNGL